MFYIQNMTVYNPNGTAAGNLPQGFSSVTGYTYWDILHEIAIAPIPGTCNQYYIIYGLNRGFVGNALKHATITVNANGTLTISTDSNVIDQNSGNSGAIAVSPDEGSGRKLYWVSGNGGVKKFDITAAGIIPVGNCPMFGEGGGGGDRSTIGHNAPPSNLQLAPNPVTDFIQFIPSDQTSRIPASRGLSIFGPQGSVVLRIDSPDLSGPIQVRALPAGVVYYYLIETELGPVSGKFVKI